MTKILYVEDDAINALIMGKLLGKHFEKIQIAKDGEEGLLVLKQEQFDIILMDINLGEGKMDGIATMKEVKKIENYKNVPIIAVTSYAMPEDEAKFLNLGFNAYYSKPIDEKNITTGIKSFL